MSDFIEEFYYGNIEPQECTTELKPKVMKCLNELAQKEKHLFDTLNDEDKELFNDIYQILKHLQRRQLHCRLQTRCKVRIRHFC